MTAAQTTATTWRTVGRVVFPSAGNEETRPLYLDSQKQPPKAVRATGRTSLSIAPGATAELGTYFNAFPASYWAHWTDARSVRLGLELVGEGTVVLYRSDAEGTARELERAVVTGVWERVLDITESEAGGWLWFKVEAGPGPVELRDASWSVPEAAATSNGTVSVAITTFNRPEYCIAQLRAFADDETLGGVVDRVIVTDQGTQRVRDGFGFEAVAARLGDRLQLVEQENLGGSGGFARGMHEAVEAGDSRYVLLLDDDVIVETEGIRRAVAFADHARTPTLVGGHMFNLYKRSVMHSFGERVELKRFFWGPVEGTHEAHDFADTQLTETPWMHRRIDVEYNGWWMCLIPTAVIREVGLSLPVFIKWDDAEFGLRAGKAGYPTVSLPGAAVWHMPWTDKDDTIDWQAYYHQRNRWLAALLYSPHPRGGDLGKKSFSVDVKHLNSMQYSAVELRLEALEDLLKGPAHLHATLATQLPHVRKTRSRFSDSTYKPTVEDFPPVRKRVDFSKKRPPHRRVLQAMVVLGTLRQFLPVPEDNVARPELVLPARHAPWWRLAFRDSVLVGSADRKSFAWYRRDARLYRRMLRRSIRRHRQLLRNWAALSERYRKDLPAFTSQDAWRRTFERATRS